MTDGGQLCTGFLESVIRWKLVRVLIGLQSTIQQGGAT